LTEFRAVTANFAVSPQIAAEDVARAKSLGFTLIINNRPDGEAPDQPSGARIAAAASAEGLAYVSIPIRGMPTPDQARAVREALAAHGKALAFCRSGTRSITAWALGELAAGATPREDLVGLAAAAGYDLSGALPS